MIGFRFAKTEFFPNGENPRAPGKNLLRTRLEMLALAKESQNISLVCRRAGISRSHFHEIQEAYDKLRG